MNMRYLALSRKLFNCSIVLLIIFSSLMGQSCRKNGAQIHDYPIQPVPFTQVRIMDNFWSKRLETNHKVTIPIAFHQAEETGRIDNFRIAGRLKEGKFSSIYPFDDSDVFKNIEAASYSLQLFPDPDLESYLDTLIGYIAAAQEPDGYLYTNRTIDPKNTHEMAGPERWINEEAHSHELYNAGHLYEAAVAHYQATGKRELIDVALRNADLIDNIFGWGKIEKAPGHQEIEIGLVKLFRTTGEVKYLDLAKFFLDVRGPDGEEYNQMHLKAKDQHEARGHAVRAQYMYSAMADIAALTADTGYLEAIGRIWQDVTEAKTYITGGVGSVRQTEGFGPPFHLPNEEAYCETCAAIANALWNYRMFLLHGDSKYYDVFEKVIYNGFLSGVSLGGDQFFYPNPLSCEGQCRRKPWFGCACCPVNITRFLPSLPGYTYATYGSVLYINLFIGSAALINLADRRFTIHQETEYPWEGRVTFRVETEQPIVFTMLIRIPGWAKNEAFPTGLYRFADTLAEKPELEINGVKEEIILDRGYARIERKWSDRDSVVLALPYQPRKVIADQRVEAVRGKTALQCGPVVYCLEDIDQPDSSIIQGKTQGSEVIIFGYDQYLLGGIGTLNGHIQTNDNQENNSSAVIYEKFRAIPYYSWANRDQNKMDVWIGMNKDRKKQE